MSGLQWHQRLHWRGALSFLVLLVLVEIPFWMLVRSMDSVDPDRAVERALGFATVGALLTVALHAAIASAYMSRRIDAAQRVLRGAVAGERFINRIPDEVATLAEDAGAQFQEMRETIVRLQQERGRLLTLLEGMGEAVLMLDDAERVLLANRVAEKLLRLPKDYQGRRLSDVCHAPRLQGLVSEVLWAHEPSELEIDFESKDETRHLSVTASPIMSGEHATGAVVVVFDQTQLRRLERVRRDFVANVSHELRTPIATIQSASETLATANVTSDPELKEIIASVERNARRMGTIVDDLLVLSRLEATGEEVVLHDVSLPAVFAEIHDRLSPLAKEKRVEFVVEIDEELPRVYAEVGALRQILQNLVQNAIKYTPQGGRVRLEAARKSDKRVRIVVSDTGPGIAPEHLPRIFERFYRVDAGRSRDIGGTGLGLAIVKHLVRKLKGKIDVESEPAKGTTFTLLLRIYRPEEQ